MSNRNETKTGICRLCIQQADLEYSHIIPRSFWSMLRDRHESNYFKLSIDPKLCGQPSSSQYKELLLCHTCEQHIKGFEDYVIDLFRTGAGSEYLQFQSYNRIRGLDYRRLRLFQLSILWRMSVSQQSFFREVSLGNKYEEQVREMLLKGDPGAPSQFPCVMTFLFASEKNLKGSFQFITSPEAKRADGHRFYRVCFGSCIWTFFVSSHFDLKKLGGLDWVVKPDGTMSVPVRNFRNMPYLMDFFAKTP